MLSRRAFGRRLARHALFAVVLVVGSLAIGVAGYMLLVPGISLVDSILNAAMLLGGMGPVGDLERWPDSAKLFASAYALFAGLVFIIVAGVLFAPVFHRIIHHFHLDLDEKE